MCSHVGYDYVYYSYHYILTLKYSSGVATIEATEVAASVKMLNNRLSRSEFWHPRFSTQTLLDSITVLHIIESMAVVL